jgi:uncharacterized protein YdhG (YjbR/CyaY superfamily)
MRLNSNVRQDKQSCSEEAVMTERAKFTSHEQYISTVPKDVQQVLLRVQGLVEGALPKAQRCISYGVPAYRAGKVFFYFAAFKNHLGVYPPVKEDAALIRELSKYRNEKGNLSFKFGEPIPYELIVRVAVALHKEYTRLQA